MRTLRRGPTAQAMRRRGITKGTGRLQEQADASARIAGLADLQRKADARTETSPGNPAPIQRTVTLTKDNNNNLNKTHSNTRKDYFKTPLITALEQEFITLGGEPAMGWKTVVWKMENDQITDHSYDDVAEFANALIEDRPRKSGGQQPEDLFFRSNIEKYASKGGTKPSRQAWGTHNMAVSGQPQDQQQFLTDLQQPHNMWGLVDSTRQGGLNETLLTSQTPEAAKRSMGGVSGVQSFAPTKSGGQQSWMSGQWLTSARTDMFAFKGTTTTPSGKIQDTHINGQTFTMDTSGKKHMTVGGTSRDYHLGEDDSLADIFNRSTRILSWARRNVKLHNEYLARLSDIVRVPANKRAQQLYVTSWGEQLDLSDPNDLTTYAKIVEVHRSKILTMLKAFEQEIEETGYESEGPVDYKAMDFTEIGLDENTQDFMEQ